MEMETSHIMSGSFADGQDWNGRSERSRRAWNDRCKDYVEDSEERRWSDYEDKKARFQYDNYRGHFQNVDERRKRDRSEGQRSYSYSPPLEIEYTNSSRESRNRSRGQWDCKEFRDRSEDRDWKRHARAPSSPTCSSNDVCFDREGRRNTRVQEWNEENDVHKPNHIKEKDTRSRFSNDSNSYNSRSSRYNPGNSRHYSEEKNYKNQSPSSTLIVRGLIQSITENDIWQAIIGTDIVPNDIRLIRRKCTGEGRGFAFVSFDSIDEAVKFMDIKQGSLMLRAKYKVALEFSMPRPPVPRFERGGLNAYHDWTCDYCGFTNFKNRDICFKCKVAHSKSSSKDAQNEVCHYRTLTVLLRSLDVLSTEESVLQSLKEVTSVPIRNIRIAHDSLTKRSLGVCYIEMHSLLDSVQLFNALTSKPFLVDGKRIQVSYHKLTPVRPSASATPASTDVESQKNSIDLKDYKVEDIPVLAEYSASLYASTPQEHAVYLQYYTQYYKSHVGQNNVVADTVPNSTETASGLCSPQIQKEEVQNTNHEEPSCTYKSFPFVPTMPGSQLPQYPVPDVSTYKYDESSGYYYDGQTGLYYNAASQYYYNPSAQQFLYWEPEKRTYVPVPTGANGTNEAKEDGKKDQEKNNKPDKIKVAKKIVKEMERWAKILNQKRDTARQNLVVSSAAAQCSKSVGSADAGFSVLERQESFSLQIMPEIQERSPIIANIGLTAEYDREESKPQLEEVDEHTNWLKLACLLCKRQFQSKESLVKHKQESSLHKSNLQKWLHNETNRRESFPVINSENVGVVFGRVNQVASQNVVSQKDSTKSFGLLNLEQYSES